MVFVLGMLFLGVHIDTLDVSCLLGGSSQDLRKWLIAMVTVVSPLTGGYSLSKWPKWLINEGLLTTY